jgi:acetyl esterase/lipase
MRRALLGVLAALAVGCGGGDEQEDRGAERRGDPAAPRSYVVGRGASSATVFVPRGGDRGRVAVVFLHGWGATRPETYGPWIRHLVGRGHVVIHPRYQDSILTPPPETLPNAVVGVRSALTGLRPRAVVAVGHSAGGALAADLAAVAAAARLPAPAAVLSLYPGRGLAGFDARLPPADLGAIPPGTRVDVLAGADDATVGTRYAREIARDATRADVTYTLIEDPAVSDHLGPQRADAASRRTFWRRLDALISERAAAGAARSR